MTFRYILAVYFCVLLSARELISDDNATAEQTDSYLDRVIEQTKESAAYTMRISILEVIKTINFTKFKERAVSELKTMPETEYKTNYADWYQRVISKTPVLVHKYKFNANSSKSYSIAFVSNLTVSACQQILNDVPDEVLLKEGLYTLSLLKSFVGNLKK